jgi:hypothetical protein
MHCWRGFDDPPENGVESVGRDRHGILAVALGLGGKLADAALLAGLSKG